MGLMDFIKKQFIDVIEWTESGEGLLAYRFPDGRQTKSSTARPSPCVSRRSPCS